MADLHGAHEASGHGTPQSESTGIWSKRTLVDVSHAIEHFALGAGGAEPMLVIAMFQRLSYFHREIDVYRRIAATGAVVVVGIVEDVPPRLPPGIAHALLSEGEPLSREWSVTVLTPTQGACLVATDLEEVRPDAVRLDAGRMFAGSWSFLREDAYAHAVRLRSALRGRIDRATAGGVESVLHAVIASAGGSAEQASARAVGHLAGRLARQHDLADGLERRNDDVTAPRDSRTGLRDPRYLDRWLSGSVPGSVPIGVLLLHVPVLADMRHELGARAEFAAHKLIGTRVEAQMRGADRAVSLGSGNVAMLLPGNRESDLSRLHSTLVKDLHDASHFYPFVDLAASAAATSTRSRPLPLDQLVQRAIDSADHDKLQLA